MQNVPFSDDLNLNSMTIQLSRLTQNETQLVQLIENDSRFKTKSFDLLKQNLDAIKNIQVKSSYTQSELLALNNTIQQAQSEQAQVVKKMNKLIKTNQNNSDPVAKYIVKYQQDIRDVALKSAHNTASFKYAQNKWKGPVPVKTGDPHANSVQREAIYNEGRASIKAQKQLAQLEALNLKVPNQAPPKFYDTSKQTDSDGSSKTFLEEHGIQLAKVFAGIGTAGTQLIQAIAQAVSQMGQAQSAIFSAMGDILDDPLSQMLGVMQGLGQTISSALSLVGGIVSSIVEGVSQIFSTDHQDSEQSGLGKLAGTILQVIGNLISSLISLAVQQIQAGFQMFTSILTQTFKILKKIQLTSPVIQAILDLINLAFNLFFMPFMNAFGLKLLEGVVNILNWALSTGMKFQEIGENLISILSEQGFSMSDIVDDVKDIAVNFVTNYLPKIIDLLPSITDFALAFVEQILNHSDQIIDFISKGITVFGEMIQGGILSDFLGLGKDVMKWVDNNGEKLVTFMTQAMNQALGLAQFFLHFINGTADVLDTLAQIPQIPDFSDPGHLAGQFVDSAQNNINPFSILINPVADWIDDTFFSASGGKYTNKTYTGGIPIIAGESNESEYKLNERELMEIGKDTTVTIQYNGSILSRSDFKAVVQDAVSDVSNKSHFR